VKFVRSGIVYAAALALLAGVGCGDAQCPPDDCSCHISPDECLAAQCVNGRADGDETGVDCGGSCGPCANAVECYRDRDCRSGFCVDQLCVESAPDGGAGGTDSEGGAGGTAGEDGGGGTAGGGTAGGGGTGGSDECVTACPVGAECTAPEACATGFCTDGVCAQEGSAPPPCELDCPVGTACTVVENCQSGVCAEGVCAPTATCGDSILNGGETATDCGGGACAGCERGSACQTNTDCSTAHCLGLVCVAGPSAGFTLDIAIGPPPLAVTVTGTMSEGDAPIATVEYRFAEGEDFVPGPQHTYDTPGTFTITQRIVDQNGFTVTTTHVVRITSGQFVPVLLNNDDKSGEDYKGDPLLLLSDDQLGVEIIESTLAGVRSDQAVFPGTGLFYFEGERTTDELFDSYIGVATSNVALTDEAGGQTNQSLVVSSEGSVKYDDGTEADFDGESSTHYGFVVDYRGATPTVYVITDNGGTGELTATVPMAAVTQPLFIFVGGRRRTVGVQSRINPGNDTTNVPFVYDPAAVLTANGIDPVGLVLGWGQTNAGAANSAPALNVPLDGTVALGNTLTLSATATDAEDGTLSSTITWVDRATPHNDPGNTYGNAGASWAYTPTAIGIHPIQVSVTDSGGLVTTETFDVEVTGTLPILPVTQVKLVKDAQSSDGAALRADGLAAKWGDDGKYGVRANQGMMGEFWYFELHRLGGTQNQGGGLMIKDGHLDPYASINVAPSCSVNYAASVWRDLISVAGYETDDTFYYGFAVDYRDRNPTVYVITQDGANATLAHTMVLPDVTVPVYPILYGNPQSNAGFDAEINFGASAFNYDPVTVLSGAGVDTSALQVGWGELP
jgi:hypothetical protein